MFLLADMQNVPNIAIIFLLKFGRSVQSIGERIKSLLCSWFLGICFPFHRTRCVFFSIWSCTEYNPRENVFQSNLTTKKQRNCRYLHAFLGQFFRANLGTCCMSGCWCWCYCCQQCLYILTRFKHSMPGYVGTIPRWSQFILVWIWFRYGPRQNTCGNFPQFSEKPILSAILKILSTWVANIQFRLTP